MKRSYLPPSGTIFALSELQIIAQSLTVPVAADYTDEDTNGEVLVREHQAPFTSNDIWCQ